MRCSAPAKINLGLALGPLRADGRHELVTVMQAITLCDELELADGEDGDRVRCDGVDGENLAARAIELLRERTGWRGPGQELRIEKRIPVAAGLGGGSSDAAAALAMVARRADVRDAALITELARELGADVPALLAPGRWLARGGGELLQALPAPVGLWALVLPAEQRLSTPEVYGRADEMGVGRSLDELDELSELVLADLAGGADLPAPELLLNDLQGAALSLEPSIAAALEEARGAGSDHAMVAGSGPTVVGLFAGEGARARCSAAAAALQSRVRPALWAQAM